MSCGASAFIIHLSCHPDLVLRGFCLQTLILVRILGTSFLLTARSGPHFTTRKSQVCFGGSRAEPLSPSTFPSFIQKTLWSLKSSLVPQLFPVPEWASHHSHSPVPSVLTGSVWSHKQSLAFTVHHKLCQQKNMSSFL